MKYVIIACFLLWIWLTRRWTIYEWHVVCSDQISRKVAEKPDCDRRELVALEKRRPPLSIWFDCAMMSMYFLMCFLFAPIAFVWAFVAALRFGVLGNWKFLVAFCLCVFVWLLLLVECVVRMIRGKMKRDENARKVFGDLFYFVDGSTKENMRIAAEILNPENPAGDREPPNKPRLKIVVWFGVFAGVALLAWLFHLVFFQSRAPRVRSVDYHFDLQTITASEFFDEGNHRVEIGCRYFVSPDRGEDAKPGLFSETPVERGEATILLRSRDEFGRFRRPFETTVEAAESIARRMEAGTMFDVPIPATVVFGSNDVHQVEFAAVVFASADREPPHKIIHAFTIAAPFEPTGDLAGHMATVYMHFCIPGTDQLSNPRVLLDFLNEVSFEN